jgi:hypothetical protein
MGTFLDAQISQNISFSGGIAIPLSSTLALFGTLGCLKNTYSFQLLTK